MSQAASTSSGSRSTLYRSSTSFSIVKQSLLLHVSEDAQYPPSRVSPPGAGGSCVIFSCFALSFSMTFAQSLRFFRLEAPDICCTNSVDAGGSPAVRPVHLELGAMASPWWPATLAIFEIGISTLSESSGIESRLSTSEK